MGRIRKEIRFVLVAVAALTAILVVFVIGFQAIWDAYRESRYRPDDGLEILSANLSADGRQVASAIACGEKIAGSGFTTSRARPSA
jgi:hypothetical protein